MTRSISHPDSEENGEIRWFNSFSEPLEGMHLFHQIYNKQSSKIWEEFEAFVTKGSGWVISNILGMTVRVNRYNPLFGGCCQTMKIPPQLINSQCLVNVKSKNNDCFKYAVACSAFYQEIRQTGQNISRPSTYKNILKNFNFKNIKTPVRLSEKDFALFEKRNPSYALNVLRLKSSSIVESRKLKSRKRKQATERKVLNIQPQRTSPYSTSGRKQLYLLALFSTAKKRDCHFVAVTNLNVLLSHCRSTKHNSYSKYCWVCKTRFVGHNYIRNYKKHFEFCSSNSSFYSPSIVRTSAYRKILQDEESGENENVSQCNNCFNYYQGGNKELREAVLHEHKKWCTCHPPAIVNFPGENEISFKSYRKRRYRPFTIYADTESLLLPQAKKKLIEEIVKNYKIQKLGHISKERKEERKDDDDGWCYEEVEEDEDEDWCDEELDLNDTDADDFYSSSDVEIDDEKLEEEPPNDNILNSHHEYSFSMKVITLPHLQNIFPKPITYRGPDAGNYLL